MVKSYVPADVLTVAPYLGLDAMDRVDLVSLSCEHIRGIVSVAYSGLVDGHGLSHQNIANLLQGIGTHLGAIEAIVESAHSSGGDV